MENLTCKFRLLLVLLSFLGLSCSTNDEAATNQENTTQASLSFSPILEDLSELRTIDKQVTGELPECTDDLPAYVGIILTNAGGQVLGTEEEPFKVALNAGSIATKEVPELQLEPGMYSLDYFGVYNSSGELIQLSPKNGAMGDIFESSLPLPIQLGAGAKKYVEVPVLCFDDRLASEYGYLFFELGTEIIPFCIFGNYCDPTGRHGTALFSVDIWKYTGDADNPKGDLLFEDQNNPLEVADYEDWQRADYFAYALCLDLPNSNGLTEFYVEISITGYVQDYDLFNLEKEVIRAGVINDREIRSLFDGENRVDYLHFREGNCNLPDEPSFFQD